MIVTKVQYFCDACGKDITDGYSGKITILVKGDSAEEIEPEGKLFCYDCMVSFNKWILSRKKGAAIVK